MGSLCFKMSERSLYSSDLFTLRVIPEVIITKKVLKRYLTLIRVNCPMHEHRLRSLKKLALVKQTWVKTNSSCYIYLLRVILFIINYQ